MEVKDEYLTLEAECYGELREKASKFLCWAFPVRDETGIKEQLAQLRELHPKATHHCYAWRLGLEGTRFRANDDGEPAGTAGRPILGQIDSKGLTQVLVAVVRYYGGTKLGASGLIQAYKAAAHAALEAGTVVAKVVLVRYCIVFHYQWMADLMGAMKRLDLPVENQEFTDTGGSLNTLVRLSKQEEVMWHLKALVCGVTLDEALVREWPEGMKVDAGEQVW